MNDDVEQALRTDRTIDITTTGRASALPRRVEIWFHNVDGTLYITGTPGVRHWYANLLANPSFTFHLKETTQADLGAKATPITDGTERRRVLEIITKRVEATQPIEEWVKRSPLVRVEFE